MNTETIPAPEGGPALTPEQLDAFMPGADGIAEANKVWTTHQGMPCCDFEEVEAWSRPLVHAAIRAALAAQPQQSGPLPEPFHPDASHIEPGYRDGWNTALKAMATQPSPAPIGWSVDSCEVGGRVGACIVRINADGRREVVATTEGPVQAAPTAPAQSPAEGDAPYLHVYEYESTFGLHREFYPCEWNGMKPTRAVPLYTRPAPNVQPKGTPVPEGVRDTIGKLLAFGKGHSATLGWPPVPEYVALEAWLASTIPCAAVAPTPPEAPGVLALIEEAFRDGFHSPRTYNDTVLNTAADAWSEEKDYFAKKLAAASQPPVHGTGQQP